MRTAIGSDLRNSPTDTIDRSCVSTLSRARHNIKYSKCQITVAASFFYYNKSLELLCFLVRSGPVKFDFERIEILILPLFVMVLNEICPLPK